MFKKKQKTNKNLDGTVKVENQEIVKQKNKKFLAKKNIIIIVIALLAITILLFVLFKFILKDNTKVSIKEDDKYAIFTDTIEYKDVKVEDYINGYYSVRNNDNKNALMDKEGNVKIEYGDHYFEKVGNLISASFGNNSILYDKNLNKVMEAENVDPYVCGNNLPVVFKNGKASLLNKNGKVLLQDYDSITCENDYIVASKNEKEDIYNKKLKLILKDVDVLEYYDFDYMGYYVNDDFILLKDGEEKVIYFVKQKKKSKKYSYAVSNNDYVAVTDNGKVILKDKTGKVVTKFNKNYEGYSIATKNLLIVPNDSCQAEAETPENLYADLYDSKGTKKTPKGCNEINIIEDDVVVRDSKNTITIYNNDKKIFTKENSKALSIYKNKFGNYNYAEENASYVLDKKGKRKIKKCKNFEQLDKDLYNCSPTYDINYIYNDNGKKLDGLYTNVSYYLNNFILVKNINNKYGLYDKNGNKILDEKYDNIAITDTIIILEYNGKTYTKLIKNGNLKEYKDFLKKDNNIKSEKKEESNINYDTINVNEIINKYGLQSNKKLISENEILFKKVAYHVINNNKLSDNDKKYLLGMFEAIIDFDKYNKIEKLLSKIDKLEVKVFNTRPSEMSDTAAGQYFDSITSIYVLSNRYDYALEHEMMHLLSYSAKIDENMNIYECSGRVRNYEEVINMTFKEQSACEVKYFNNDNRLLEEAAAEYFTTVVYENDPYQTYHNNINVYVLLQYILEDDFKELQYSPSKVNVLYKLLNEKIGYDYEKSSSLINALDDVSKIEYYDVESKAEEAYILYHMADELINLYTAKNIGDWKDNEYLCSVIQSLLNNSPKWNLDKYLKSNPDKKIEYYNDLVNLNYENYVRDKLKETNSNVFFQSWYYAYNKIVAHGEAPTDPCNFTLELYYNENGKLIDKKVNISDEPVG